MTKPKQPDRWEKIAERIRLEHTGSPWSTLQLNRDWPTIQSRIAIAMRREHRAIVRMVQKEKLVRGRCDDPLPTYAGHYNNAIETVLAKLKARGQ